MTREERQGQQTMANSIPVVLASDQSAIPTTVGGTVDVSDRFARLVGGVWPFWRDSAGTRALPTWRIAAPVTAPAAGGALITIAAGGAGVIHRCFGWYAGNELGAANLIQIRDGATIRTGIGIGTGTPLYLLSPIPIVIGTANTAMSANVLNAGAAGEDYVAALLVESV